MSSATQATTEINVIIIIIIIIISRRKHSRSAKGENFHYRSHTTLEYLFSTIFNLSFLSFKPAWSVKHNNAAS